MRRWIVPILVLPGTVLVIVPGLLLWLTREYRPAPVDSWRFWAGLICFLGGGFLAGGSMWMFFRFGKGTPAPWEPPERFVVRGLYRYCRNPMITGVVLLLVAGALLLQSWPVAAWAALFFLGNSCYFPLFEEPGLRRRFGDDYRMYCENVGRWVPRLNPWTPPWEEEEKPGDETDGSAEGS